MRPAAVEHHGDGGARLRQEIAGHSGMQHPARSVHREPDQRGSSQEPCVDHPRLRKARAGLLEQNALGPDQRHGGASLRQPRRGDGPERRLDAALTDTAFEPLDLAGRRCFEIAFDVGMQRWLVVLDGQKIVSLGVEDALGDVGIASHGVD